jgi:glycosyltransferase involved in cell wall biosynthesis
MVAPETVTISIVVPVYNGGERFRLCMAALAGLSPCPLEIIVVANGDTDGSGDLAMSYGARVIRVPTPSGPALARNLGAQAARGSILFFVDADVVAPRDAVARVADLFAQDLTLDAVIGSYDDTPGDPGFLSQFRNLLHHYVHQQGQEEASTFWGACGAIRYEVFAAQGGFSDRYRKPSIEDIELGYRLKESGARIRLCKTLQVTHLKRWTALSILRTDLFHRAIPWTLLIHRCRRIANDLNLRLCERISVATAMVLALALAAGAWWHPLFLVAPAAGLLLVGLNARFYAFCFRKRGFWFMCKSLPWHWLYFLYSGIGFGLGTLWHALGLCGESHWPGGIAASRVESGR